MRRALIAAALSVLGACTETQNYSLGETPPDAGPYAVVWKCVDGGIIDFGDGGFVGAVDTVVRYVQCQPDPYAPGCPGRIIIDCMPIPEPIVFAPPAIPAPKDAGP